jgi:hypothetical protein
MATEVTIRSSDLADLARDARRAGRRDLNREMTKRLRVTLKPAVPAVRAAVRATPGGTNEGRSAAARAARPRDLRDAIARGVQIKVSLSSGYAGVRLRVDPRHFPDGQKNLPKYVEGTLNRWRSKNWGRDEWKTQRPHPFFFRTIQPYIPAVRAEMKAIVDDIQDQLTRGGAA